MSRRRLLVAALPPPRIAQACRVLRRALGDGRAERIAPHITVVPPVNVSADDFEAVSSHIHSVAQNTKPFSVQIAAVESFLPATPTIHLAIGESDGSPLTDLRLRLMSGPLARNENRPFAPHVTLRERVEPEIIDQALAVLARADFAWGGEPGWQVDRIHLMEQFRSADRGTYWQPIAEEAFGEPIVVGRGGVELIFRREGIVAPPTAALFADTDGSAAENNGRFLAGSDISSTPEWLVAIAGEPNLVIVNAQEPGRIGHPVGSAVGYLNGEAASLNGVFVAATSRRIGIGRQLISQWLHQVASGGARLVWVDTTPWAAHTAHVAAAVACAGSSSADAAPAEAAAAASIESLLASTGFVRQGPLWVRVL